MAHKAILDGKGIIPQRDGRRSFRAWVKVVEETTGELAGSYQFELTLGHGAVDTEGINAQLQEFAAEKVAEADANAAIDLGAIDLL